MSHLLLRWSSWLPLPLKSNEQGFTLLELLIVVVIMGILSAIAIPSLLGQVGKARESEARSTLGAVNRAQQAYFAEHSDLATTLSDLQIDVDDHKYYTYLIGSGMILAKGKDNPNNGTRNYAGGVQYKTTTRQFDSIICRSTTAPNYGGVGVQNSGINSGKFSNFTLKCDSNSQPVK